MIDYVFILDEVNDVVVKHEVLLQDDKSVSVLISGYLVSFEVGRDVHLSEAAAFASKKRVA